MRKKYFTDKVYKCTSKNYAPCLYDREHLLHVLANNMEEVLACARDLLQDNFPQNFIMPKLKFLDERKTNTFGKYALNMLLLEEERLANIQDEAKQAKLAEMRANVKVVMPVKGSFNPDRGITLYLCNICEYCGLHKLDIEAYLISVFAHEVFHAIHYVMCAEVNKWEVGSAAHRSFWRGEGYVLQEAATVRESFAEYFRYTWITRQQDEQLLALFHAELQAPHAVAPSFPYAGVKGLLGKESDEVRRKFAVTVCSWRDGYLNLE